MGSKSISLDRISKSMERVLIKVIQVYVNFSKPIIFPEDIAWLGEQRNNFANSKHLINALRKDSI